MRRLGRLALPLIGFALAGCRWQSVLDPQGPQANELAWLFWLFTWVLGAIWLAVMIALVLALVGRRPPRTDPLAVDPAQDRRYTAVVTGLAVATGVVVLVLTGLSYVSQRNLFRVEEEAVTIRVTGRQWW
jgi:cytochrome c oxidase subunit 2